MGGFTEIPSYQPERTENYRSKAEPQKFTPGKSRRWFVCILLVLGNAGDDVIDSLKDLIYNM